MGRRAKDPYAAVQPVSSKKQLLTAEEVRKLLGGVSHDTFARLRDDDEARFPKPLQIFKSPMWTVDQIERWIARHEKQVEAIGA